MNDMNKPDIQKLIAARLEELGLTRLSRMFSVEHNVPRGTHKAGVAGSNVLDHERYHSVLSADHPDALAGAVAAGAMIIGNATPAWSLLAKGAENQVLDMGAALPKWGRKITISDSPPSGGSDGDIHLEY